MEQIPKQLLNQLANLSEQIANLQNSVNIALSKEDFIEVNDFSQKTGMSLRTIHRHRQDGRIKVYKLERKLYVRWSEFTNLLEVEQVA